MRYSFCFDTIGVSGQPENVLIRVKAVTADTGKVERIEPIDPPRLKVWDSRPEHDSVSRQNPCPAQKQKRRQTFCALPQLGVNNPKPTDKTIVAQPDLRCKSASLTQTKSLGLRLAKAVHPAMLCDPHHHKRIGHAHQTMSHVFFVGRICSYGM